MTDKTPEFALLWGRSQRQVAAYIRGGVINEHDAEDLFQEVVVIAAKRFDEYDRSKPFKPWVLGISRNVILTYYRKHKRDQKVLPETVLVDVAQAVARQSEDENERLDALRHCMSLLSKRDKSILERRYEQGQKIKAIAEELGTTQNKISVVMYRIRRTLMSCINNKLATKPHFE